MTTAEHDIFGTGAILLATYEALRRRGDDLDLMEQVGGEQDGATEVG